MSKFNSPLAERLYDAEPDDSIGSVDELGWFGLFLDQAGSGGQILTEDSYGFVTVWEFDNDRDLNDEWHSIENDYREFDGSDY